MPPRAYRQVVAAVGQRAAAVTAGRQRAAVGATNCSPSWMPVACALLAELGARGLRAASRMQTPAHRQVAAADRLRAGGHRRA
jgi:hypothetical protein